MGYLKVTNPEDIEKSNTTLYPNSYKLRSALTCYNLILFPYLFVVSLSNYKFQAISGENDSLKKLKLPTRDRTRGHNVVTYLIFAALILIKSSYRPTRLYDDLRI